MVQLLEALLTLVGNPGRVENQQPLFREYYKEITPLGHLIQSGNCPLGFNYTYEARVSFDEGTQRKQRFITRNSYRIVFELFAFTFHYPFASVKSDYKETKQTKGR
jgi:hypothetical protein